MIGSLFCILGLTLNLAAASSEEKATLPKTFYVSPQGSDKNPGTETAPFKSIRFAQQAVRRALRKKKATILTVYLRQGVLPFLIRHLYSICWTQLPMVAGSSTRPFPMNPRLSRQVGPSQIGGAWKSESLVYLLKLRIMYG